MSTKAPSSVKPAAESALERIAYASVADIPTLEPHDQDRLGYNVWRFLKYRQDSLDAAVRSAGARMAVSEDEALRRISANLQKLGVEL